MCNCGVVVKTGYSSSSRGTSHQCDYNNICVSSAFWGVVVLVLVLVLVTCLEQN